MKNAIRIISIALVIVIVGVMLVSCSKMLMGTYSSSASVLGLAGGKMSYTFSGSNVTITITTEILGSTSTSEYKGTYEITKATDGTENITFKFEGDGSSYSGTYSFSEGKTDAGVKTIIIGGSTYTKQ